MRITEGVLSKGHDNDIVTNIFVKLPEIFTEEPHPSIVNAKFVGLIDNKRCFRYINREYIRPHPNLEKWKVVLPKSNGSGAIGEVLSTPLLGHTQSFISIGTFENKGEAENCLKYIKTKFTRTLLGILKITQDNKKGVWKYVPLQDFTSSSDIGWTLPIPEIDAQLFRKYRLSPDEISFIKRMVRPME